MALQSTYITLRMTRTLSAFKITLAISALKLATFIGLLCQCCATKQFAYSEVLHLVNDTIFFSKGCFSKNFLMGSLWIIDLSCLCKLCDLIKYYFWFLQALWNLSDPFKILCWIPMFIFKPCLQVNVFFNWFVNDRLEFLIQFIFTWKSWFFIVSGEGRLNALLKKNPSPLCGLSLKHLSFSNILLNSGNYAK